MSKDFGYIELCINGMNVEVFLVKVKNSGINLKDIIRHKYNEFYVKVSTRDYKKFMDFSNKMCYNTSVVKNSSAISIKSLFLNKISFLLAFIFISIIFYGLNLRIFQIDINGLSLIDQKQIIQLLEDNGIFSGCSKLKCNTDDVESLIYENISLVSLVSAYIRGNTLIINIKEKIFVEELQENFENIVAPFDCIIESIELISGTALVKKGDVVKSGDILVLSEIRDNENNSKKVIARANIKALVEYVGREEYKEVHFEKQRTGKNITNKKFFIFGFEIFSRNIENTFDYFEVENKDVYPFKNNFLPLTINEEIIYELTSIEVNIPFEQVEQSLKERALSDARDKIDDNIEVVSENVFVNFINNTYYTTAYVRTIQDIK